MIEPFGEDRADNRAGIIASTVANVNRGKGKKAYSFEDFKIKYYKPAKERLSQPVLVARLKTLKQLINGKTKKTK